MKHNFIFLWVFLCIFNIIDSNLFGQSITDTEITTHQFFEEVTTHYSNCVKDVTKDKIYLYSDAIRTTPEGVYLKNNRSLLPLMHLFSDQNGPYLSTSTELVPMSLVRCIGCGWTRFSGDYCRNPDCPLAKK